MRFPRRPMIIALLCLWWLTLLTVVFFFVRDCDGSRSSTTTDLFRPRQPKDPGDMGHFLEYLPRGLPIPYSRPSRNHNDIEVEGLPAELAQKELGLGPNPSPPIHVHNHLKRSPPPPQFPVKEIRHVCEVMECLPCQWHRSYLPYLRPHSSFWCSYLEKGSSTDDNEDRSSANWWVARL